MKKSIFLFFAAILCATSAWAWDVEQGKVYYFKPSSVWKSDGARFAVAFGSGDNTYAWESCVAVSGETDVYYIVSPGNYDWMIFCRMKPSTSNDWANRWNESQRVQPNNNYNKFDLKANWATDFNWYKYAPPMKSASITNTSTVYGGDGTQGNPYQIKKGTSISVSATATSTVTADNQTKYYKFYKKENSGSRSSVGNESTTSTCSFTTSSTVGTKYAVDVEARNEYYSNYGTKATSSTLYFITIEPIYAILGSFNDWTHSANTWDLSDQGSNNWKATFHLDKGSHTFKVVHNSSYYGKNNTTITRASATTSNLSTSGANINLTTDIAGDYTFTFNSSDKKLTVAYPALPKYQVSATVNPAESGTVTGTGEYEQGSEATLDATPAEGYKFVNWTKGEEVVSTTATYKVTVTEPVELVANFERVHDVTITYKCNGVEMQSTTQSIGESTPSTITAPAIAGYTFSSWTLGAGVQSADATANPISITTKSGESDYTLVANYNEDLTSGWVLRGSFVDDFATAYDFTKKSGESTGKIAYTTVELAANKEYHFKVVKDDTWYGNSNNTDGEKWWIKQTTENWTFKSSDGGDCYMKSGLAGTYTFKIDYSGSNPKVSVIYPIAYTITATAANGTVEGAGTYVEGTTVYLTATPAEGYHFVKWSNESTTNPLTITVTEDIELQAIFDINTYTITATAENGKVTGTGEYTHGANVTLTATANEGYKFINWTKGSEIVSTDATYTFTATEDAELVANFKATIITLTTGNNDAIIAANIGNTVDVVIKRSFTANDGYYTLCVPFNMPASVIGKAYSLGTITEHVAGEGININLEEKNELSAGMPYLVLPKANMTELVVENVTIAEDDIAGQDVRNEELNVQIFFQGYYSAPGVTTNGTTQYYVGNNGYLYNGEVEIRGLSGLFTITDTEGYPAKVRARVVTREDAATGFENITNGENTTIKVIENGQLIIIRNGEKFNAQGVRF